MRNADAVRSFFRSYGAAVVGTTPPQPAMPAGETDEAKPTVTLGVEFPSDSWQTLTVPEAPAKPGEFPVWFVDGCQAGQPVVCVRAPAGWPIPLLLAEVGAVALRLDGRGFTRTFAAVERVLSFVADPFPWEEVEAFAAAVVNDPELNLRVLPANMPVGHHPFDYEAYLNHAIARMEEERKNLERIAIRVGAAFPTLVDGSLPTRMGEPAATGPLVVGVAKLQAAAYLHDEGWRVLYDLRPGQRTPVFRIDPPGEFPVATWYLKLAGGPRLAPNWGYVRVELPWGQFAQLFAGDFGFVHRLSRWLIDARCRQESYARMPVSLDPIVRAEESLKPLFTEPSVLAHRLVRRAAFAGTSAP